MARPVVKLPTAERFGLSGNKEQRLSEIIDEINSRTGKNYDTDVVVKAMLQIRDILVKSERMRTSAKNTTRQDFEFSCFDDVDDALIEGLSQDQDFYTLLLENDEIKREVLGIFSYEIIGACARRAWRCLRRTEGDVGAYLSGRARRQEERQASTMPPRRRVSCIPAP